jgi:hypothetical protein
MKRQTGSLIDARPVLLVGCKWEQQKSTGIPMFYHREVHMPPLNVGGSISHLGKRVM